MQDDIIREMICYVATSPFYRSGRMTASYESTVCPCILYTNMDDANIWGITCNRCAWRWPALFPPITFLRRRKMMWVLGTRTPCVICHQHAWGSIAHFKYHCMQCAQMNANDSVRLAKIAALLTQMIPGDVVGVIMEIIVRV